MKYTIGAVALFALAACGTGESRATSESGATESVTVKVVYSAEGTATGARTTYKTPTGTQQGNPVIPMMNKAGTAGLQMAFPRGEFLYFSAQNDGYGELTCRITVDGVVISENTSSGRFGIATCEGRS